MHSWKACLFARFNLRAEPVMMSEDGLRSAASLWSGSTMWAGLLRREPSASVRLVSSDRLTCIQLLMAALWNGTGLHLGLSPTEASGRNGWLVDADEVFLAQTCVARVVPGGWPEPLFGTGFAAPSSAVAATDGAHGNLQVGRVTASYDALLDQLFERLTPSKTQHPRQIMLPPFDLSRIDTPFGLLEATLVPLFTAEEIVLRTH